MPRSAALLLLLATSAGTFASEAPETGAPVRSPLSAEAMWNLARVGEPAISPDDRTAVVSVTRFDIAENKPLTDLWLIPVAAGAAKQLTSDPGPDTQPVFSPDGKSIAFVSKRGNDPAPQIYVIAVNGGEARRVTQVATGARLPRWFPDGTRLAFVSAVWPDVVRWEDQARRVKERDKPTMNARVWDKAPISYWDRLLDEREPHVFSVPVAGGEPFPITRSSGRFLSRKDHDAFSYDISPDGLEIAIVSDSDPSGIDPNLDVIAVPSCGCKPARNLTADSPADDDDVRYSPDGRHLAFVQQRIKGFYGDRTRLMVLDRPSGKGRELAADWDRSVTNPVWLPGGGALLAAIDDGGTARVYRFALNGAAPAALTTDGSFSDLGVSKGAAVALRQSFSEPPALVRMEISTGRATPLSTFNDAALAATAFGKVESVTYPGARGDPIQMWVVYPPGFDPARKYPLYMLLHGGPHNSVLNATQWRWNAQVFAGWGYVVTWHNFHGSSGFGQDFTDSVNPDRIGLPYEDTIKAAEWLAAQPYVDRERMVAGGGSYGGFLAATLLGRAHPFKALVAHAAVYNGFTQMGADYGAERPRFFQFWEKPEEFARYSPHSAAANFRTPTLVIHGQQDLRVPVNHALELFNTLQVRGVPSRFIYFPDETHWVLKPQNSLFWYQSVREWLAQYAPPGPR